VKFRPFRLESSYLVTPLSQLHPTCEFFFCFFFQKEEKMANFQLLLLHSDTIEKSISISTSQNEQLDMRGGKKTKKKMIMMMMKKGKLCGRNRKSNRI
jgi:hypothetical protein